MKKILFLSAMLAATSPQSAVAADNAAAMAPAAATRMPAGPARSITPIFGQLLVYSFPAGFKPAFEEAKGAGYIQESVPDGESIKKWSQMVTVTGAKGLAANPKVTPQVLANGIAGGFRKVCPASFGATGLGTLKLGRHEGYAAVVSCGVANAGEGYSESMLLVVIKGDSDYYTVQWAERAAASAAPIKFDEAKWSERFRKLMPIRLCPIVPGERAPYPSCIEGA